MRVRCSMLGLALVLVGCQTPVPAPTAEKKSSMNAAKKPAATASQAPLAQRPPVTVPGGGSLAPVTPPGPPPAGTTPSAAPAASAAPALPAQPAAVSLAGLVSAPAGIIANNGGALIANNGGGLLSDKGNGLIANNGGGVVSNNGGTYRVQALAQAPLAGARVYVLDAQGRPLRGPDGTALFTTTDAQGRYAFTGELPSHNFRLAVELADGRGLWQAVLPKEGASPRSADVDLISTLTTSYILGQYVAGQADEQATLDKLPPAVEADTRAKARAAFDAAGEAVPERFDPDAAKPVVDALRAKDAAFDGQMETVKKLLIAAGQSDFGNGQAATSVRFGRLRTVLPLPDGGFWLCSQDDGRLWHVDPAGKLIALAGTGKKGAAPVAGQLATAAALENPASLTRDADGRLCFVEGDRLWRVGADGKLEAIATGLSRPEYLFATGPGAFKVADFGGGVYGVAGGAATGGGGIGFSGLDRLQSAGLRPDGAVATVRGSSVAGNPMAVKGVGAIAGGEATVPTLPGNLVGVAQDGTWVSHDADGSFVFTPPTGAARRFPLAQVKQLPDFPPFTQFRNNAVDANGWWNVNFAHAGERCFVYSMYELHELLADGTVKHVAGLDPGRVATGEAGAVSLDTPTGAAVAADGTLYVVDDALKQVLKRDLAGAITKFSGIGGWEIASLSRPGPGKATLKYGDSPAIEFGATYAAPAADARYSFPSLLRLDAAGRVMVLDMSTFLRRLEANGDLKSVLDVGSGAGIADYLPRPDGTTLLAVADGQGARIERLAADGGRTKLADVPGVTYTYGAAPLSIAAGADGRIYALANAKLGEVKAGAFTTLLEAPELAATGGGAGNHSVARLAVDAQHRLYATVGDKVYRWAPGATALEVLAGAGGKLLAGDTADDGLQEALSPTFGPGGELYVVDKGNKQVKRLEAKDL